MISDMSSERSPASDATRGGGGRGPLVVASDGTEGAMAAIRLTRLLARRLQCEVEIVTVLEPLPIPPVQPMLFSAPPDFEAGRRSSLLAAVRAQARAVFGDEAPEVALEEGDAAVAVAQSAASRNARAVVVGLSRHGAVDRLLGGETALELLRLVDVPVLAVAVGSQGLPRRALAAIDFSDASVSAARLARSMLHEEASLVLAHVVPTEIGMLAGTSYEAGCEAAFGEVRTALDVGENARVETVMLHGSPAHELLALASSADCDLIVTGREGAGAVRRLIVGSVATRLLRGASCSVLVVPAAGK